MDGNANPHAGNDDPHGDQPVATAGATLEDANAVVVLVHGRGATAESILGMASEFEHEDVTGEFDRDDVAYLAPQARGQTWYPNSFLAPIVSNEPGLSSGLGVLGDLVDRSARNGVPAERILFVGFSQGACLASEFVARNARRYGGLAVLSGGLIGPEGTEFDYEGSLDGTPVFLGCSDSDPHIPVERVHETRDVLADLGGDVEERIYEGMGHGINEDELDFVRGMVDRVSSRE